MFRTLCFVSCLVFPSMRIAAGQVNHLDVNGNMVVFGTDAAKSAASPACMDAANADKWAVSLNSESGRAIYSMLMTATVTKMAVTVESAGDCADQPGFERAVGVELDVAASSQNSAKVEWAGYTALTTGDFETASGRQTSPLVEGTKKCAAMYSGSRLMLWEDFVQLSNEYPMTENVWIIDGVQGRLDSHIITRDGQDVSYSESSRPGATSCYGWNSSGGTHYGLMMNRYGAFSLGKCNSQFRLACVK